MTAPLFEQPTAAGETEIGALMRSLMLGYTVAAADTPRSRQASLGLSEYAAPCHRQVAMKVAGHPVVNSTGDRWASTLGTWGHAGLTDVIAQAPDADDWLLDHPVMLAGIVPGRLDAYHQPTGTVVDFKFSGPNTIGQYRRHGPPAVYEGQIQGYARALADEGFPVQHVALAFFPRAHNLADFWVWAAPYDAEVSARALSRLETLYDLLDALALWDGANPEQWAELPAVPSDRCIWCPFFRPGAQVNGDGCPGNRKETT